MDERIYGPILIVAFCLLSLGYLIRYGERDYQKSVAFRRQFGLWVWPRELYLVPNYAALVILLIVALAFLVNSLLQAA